MGAEKDKLDNARRKGRKAFYEGLKLTDNPMRAIDSRHAWADAWEQAEAASKRSLDSQDCVMCGDPVTGRSVCEKCLEKTS